MKRTQLVAVFGIAVSLLFLQLSCAGMKERPAAEVSPAAETSPKATQFLAGTHHAAGVSCSDCHEESPPANAVPKAVCLKCHEDYNAPATSYGDPHNAHIEFPDCSDCHHAHRASENQCLTCHSF